MLTVVSKGHTLLPSSSSSDANKVIRLDFIKEGKLSFFCQNSAILLEVTLMERCSNANSRMMSYCFSDVDADKKHRI